MSGQALIWSFKHGGAWWREAGRGYTADITNAGLFDVHEAKAQEERTEGECVAVRPDVAFAIVGAERHRLRERAITEDGAVRVWADRFREEPTP